MAAKSHRPTLLGAAERAYLRLDNPRLIELKASYRGHPAAAASQWAEDFVAQQIDLTHFRGDNAFLWQVRGGDAAARHRRTALYAQDHDRLGLYRRLGEDGAFGAHVFELDGKIVSRDLIDSVIEIDFLERHIGIAEIANAQILDIGAGYGRFAHRLLEGLASVGRVYLADAIAESSFLAEFYMRYRGLSDRAEIVPLDRAEARIGTLALDLAINIHSFSECPMAAIGWWLDLLARARPRYILIVPNHIDRLWSREARRRDRLDFRPAIEAKGYRLKAYERLYGDQPDLQQDGLYPAASFHLFERV